MYDCSIDLPRHRAHVDPMLSFRKRWLFLALFVGPGLLAARSEDASPLPTCAIVLPAGTSLFCPPLPTDGRLDGALGTQLAGAVDKITLWLPGTTNTVSLRPNSDRAWTDESGMPYPRALELGQGFIIHREADAPVTLVFTGLFATTQHQTLTLPEGMSIIGFPNGRAMALATAFENPVAGRPTFSFDDTKADTMAFLNPDGSWRRLLRLTDQSWYDAHTLTNTTLVLQPGQAIYYNRQPGHGPLQIGF